MVPRRAATRLHQIIFPLVCMKKTPKKGGGALHFLGTSLTGCCFEELANIKPPKNPSARAPYLANFKAGEAPAADVIIMMRKFKASIFCVSLIDEIPSSSNPMTTKKVSRFSSRVKSMRGASWGETDRPYHQNELGSPARKGSKKVLGFFNCALFIDIAYT